MNLRINCNSVEVAAVCLAVIALLPSAPIAAQDSEGGSGSNIVTSIPRTMSYQGILKDSGGDPVVDSVYNVTFRIFDVSSGGTSLWDETLPCTTSAGYFGTIFSNVNLPFDEDYWLELEVGGDILDPRQKINMVGYAAVSDTADYAFNAPAGGSGGWVDDGTVVRLETTTDRVGIGISSPAGILHVAADSDFAVVATIAPGGSEDNTGVVGYVDGGTGTNTGVSGNANNGYVNRGVSGQAEGFGSENIGVFGYAQGGTVNWAGYFDGDVAVEHDMAVMDKATIGPGHTNTGTSSFTVGESNRATGLASFAAGRRAKADHNGAFVWGDDTEADFQSTADNQFLIRATGGVGIGTNSPAAGLHVNSESGLNSDNIGILGNAANGTYNKGIVGEAHGLSDENIGVYGYAEGGDDNWAGYFNGDVGVAQNVEIQGKAAIGPGSSNAGSSAFAVGQSCSAAGDYSFAAGRRAKANHNGSFVWGDSTDADFTTTGENQFLIRASGGVGIGWHGPQAALHIQPTSLPPSPSGPTGLLISTPATLEDSYGIQVSCFATNATGAQIVGGFRGIDAVSANGEAIRAEGFVGIHAMSTGDTAGFFEGNIVASGDLEIQGKAAIGPGSASDGDNSFAAGTRAKADHNGAFVWGDSSDADFASTADNQFLVRASGGVGIGTNSPQGALDISSTTGAFIVPRMSTTERDALTPVNGMIIYNIGNNQFNFYENGAWVTK